MTSQNVLAIGIDDSRQAFRSSRGKSPWGVCVLDARMSLEERTAYDAFLKKRYEPETTRVAKNTCKDNVDSVSNAVAAVSLGDDKDLSPADKFLRDWVNANHKYAIAVRKAVLTEANELIHAASHFRRITLKPSKVAFFNRIRDWDLV